MLFRSEVVTSKPVIEKKLENEQVEVNKIVNKEIQQKAQNTLDAKKAIINALPDFNTLPEVRRVEDLNKEEVKRKVIRQIEKKLSEGQQNIFAEDIIKEAEESYEKIVASYKENIIEIPRMDLVLGDVTATFNHFDLDTTNFNYQALEQEIIRMGLLDKSIETLKAKSSGSYGNPIKNIISELINYSDVDYDDNADLLYHLANQA